ncbi:MAG: glucoamylase family protein, partial [Bacteroidales bacterium]
LMIFLSLAAKAQEIWIFSEGTDQTYYDQGIVDVANLGSSLFEHTSPPGLPQYNDKVPCSTTAFKGSTSLKFNYTSASGGNWKASIFRSGWTTADITGMDSISFFAYSTAEVPSSALPLIGLRAMNKTGSGEVSSAMYKLSDYNGNIPAGAWTHVKFPLSIIMNDSGNSDLNFTAIKAVIFSQSETNNTSRTILIDEITVYKSLLVIPAVSHLAGTGYDSHAELTWTPPVANLSYRIYASFDDGANYEMRGETTDSIYLDFVPPAGKNKTVQYKVVTLAQYRESDPLATSAMLRDYTDEELLDMTQRYAFRYFWEGAHQESGMALERTDGGSSTAASGATGMGLMAMIVAHEREYRPKEEIKDRVLKILSFLETCDRYHGAWSHWYNADTKHTQPFTTDDDGGDLVETSYLAQALIALKHYFSGQDTKSVQIREKADLLWKGVDWNWYRQYGQNVLYWHWSPNYLFLKNMKITGWNEALITYVMAASSPDYGIPKEVYTQGWARNGAMAVKRTYYGYEIKLSPDYGGPLFWVQYSHLGINPHGLTDQYADYWQEYVNTVRIHHAYAVANPFGFENYGDKCWGLTASDDPYGYTAHQPVSNDNGTISPTAALASMPYAPEDALKALKYFYRERGKDIYGPFGPYDAFNDHLNWVKKAYIGIDQGPIVVMIENYRTGLLWNSFMVDADVRAGLTKLGFLTTSVSPVLISPEVFKIYPNPCTGRAYIRLSGFEQPVLMNIFTTDGRLVRSEQLNDASPVVSFDFSDLGNGYYIVRLSDRWKTGQAKLLIQK